nr:zinc finger CCHC domain-containing protein 8-like [Tanacetum cinerariifolium]
MGADLQDELAKPSSKRTREIDDEQTSVQISFKRLTRKSKKKLEELLHQWSEWHAQECSLSEDRDEDFECGEETYYPALNAGTDKSCTIYK